MERGPVGDFLAVLGEFSIPPIIERGRGMVLFRMDARYSDVMRVLRDVIVPLVEADRGEIFLVSNEGNRLAVHLSGRLAGSPGNGLFCRRVLEPAIHSIAPDVEVILSTGSQIPDGAVRLSKGSDSET